MGLPISGSSTLLSAARMAASDGAVAFIGIQLSRARRSRFRRSAKRCRARTTALPHRAWRPHRAWWQCRVSGRRAWGAGLRGLTRLRLLVRPGGRLRRSRSALGTAELRWQAHDEAVFLLLLRLAAGLLGLGLGPGAFASPGLSSPGFLGSFLFLSLSLSFSASTGVACMSGMPWVGITPVEYAPAQARTLVT